MLDDIAAPFTPPIKSVPTIQSRGIRMKFRITFTISEKTDTHIETYGLPRLKKSAANTFANDIEKIPGIRSIIGAYASSHSGPYRNPRAHLPIIARARIAIATMIVTILRLGGTSF